MEKKKTIDIHKKRQNYVFTCDIISSHPLKKFVKSWPKFFSFSSVFYPPVAFNFVIFLLSGFCSAEELKEHPFFAGIDWNLVYYQKVGRGGRRNLNGCRTRDGRVVGGMRRDGRHGGCVLDVGGERSVGRGSVSSFLPPLLFMGHWVGEEKKTGMD